MGSIIRDIACPQCGRYAFEDQYYTSEEKYVWCTHCGYNFSNGPRYDEETDKFHWERAEYKGYGVFRHYRKDDDNTLYFLNSPLDEKSLQSYKEKFEKHDTDREKSLLVKYENGEFICLLGKLSEGFIYPYDEYLKWYKENKRPNAELQQG